MKITKTRNTCPHCGLNIGIPPPGHYGYMKGQRLIRLEPNGSNYVIGCEKCFNKFLSDHDGIIVRRTMDKTSDSISLDFNRLVIFKNLPFTRIIRRKWNSIKNRAIHLYGKNT